VDAPLLANPTSPQITGSVFNDWNNDGKREVKGSPEPDMVGVTVYIDANKNGKLDSKETSIKTDVSGDYTIKLSKAGSYRVAVSLPKGFVGTTPSFFDVKAADQSRITERFALTPSDKTDTISEAKAATAISTKASLFDSINSATDVNVYRFTVKAGQTLSFDIDALSGSSLDSYLRLFDASGTQLAKDDNGAAPGEGVGIDSFIKFKFTKAGTYYIAVSDHLNTSYSVTTGKGDIGTGTRGKYSLSVTGG
jgi:hypothetical protein